MAEVDLLFGNANYEEGFPALLSEITGGMSFADMQLSVSPEFVVRAFGAVQDEYLVLSPADRKAWICVTAMMLGKHPEATATVLELSQKHIRDLAAQVKAQNV